MARQIKVNNEAREKYAYWAFPKKLERTLQTMVTQDAGKYGIENVKDLIKCIVMEVIISYEKNHRYIEAAEWASENWQKNRFSNLSASNVDDKLGKTDLTKILSEELKDLKQRQDRVAKLLEKAVV